MKTTNPGSPSAPSAATKILKNHVAVVGDSSKSFEKCSDRQPIPAVSVRTIMGAGREPGQGTATLVQAVNDLPKAQASLRDEFAGTSRCSSHRSQSPRRPVVAAFAPAGRLIVGRSFMACATTVIATARLSTRFFHRYSVTTCVRAWRAVGMLLARLPVIVDDLVNSLTRNSKTRLRLQVIHPRILQEKVASVSIVEIGGTPPCHTPRAIPAGISHAEPRRARRNALCWGRRVADA